MSSLLTPLWEIPPEKQKDIENAAVCVYQRPSGTTIVVRRNESKNGFPLTIPGGERKSSDNSLEDAACREWVEETGLIPPHEIAAYSKGYLWKTHTALYIYIVDEDYDLTKVDPDSEVVAVLALRVDTILGSCNPEKGGQLSEVNKIPWWEISSFSTPAVLTEVLCLNKLMLGFEVEWHEARIAELKSQTWSTVDEEKTRLELCIAHTTIALRLKDQIMSHMETLEPMIYCYA